MNEMHACMREFCGERKLVDAEREEVANVLDHF